MAAFRLFHQREQDKELAQKELSYNELPPELRVKILYLLDKYLGAYVIDNPWDYGMGPDTPISNETWDFAEKELREALGRLSIGNGKGSKAKYSSFILSATFDEALSAIELAFLIGKYGYTKLHRDDWQREKSGISINPEQAIEKVNELFKIHRIGYQILENKIVKVDSAYLHSETVSKVTNSLAEFHFKGPIDEFKQALEHHRRDEPENALNWANRAFESTMKAICDEKKWKYSSKAVASDLIPIITKSLLPSYFNPQLGGTKSILEALTAARGQVATHGDGKTKKKIPRYVTSYAIHQAATTILLLVDAYKEQSK